MIHVNEPVLLDPDASPPHVFIETKGLVIDIHQLLLRARNNATRWEADGSNIPIDDDDEGTPDRYPIIDFIQHNNNILEMVIDLFNQTNEVQEFSLRVEIHQADYEPDEIINVEGELGAEENDKTQLFRAFVPLRLM